jgi:hypothetical protein
MSDTSSHGKVIEPDALRTTGPFAKVKFLWTLEIGSATLLFLTRSGFGLLDFDTE